MASVQSLFTGKTKPGLYRLRSGVKDEVIERLAKEHDWRVVRINGDKINDKASFIRVVGKALDFPDYSGANWDAFEESLRDLSWLAGKGVVVLYDEPSRFAAADGKAWDIARDILSDAPKILQTNDKTLAILFRRAGRALPDVPWL